MTHKPKRIRRYIAAAVVVVIVALTIKFVLHLVLPRNFKATGSMVTLNLSGGDLNCPYFAPTQLKQNATSPSPGDEIEPVGIIILATGDGGWSYWEDNTAHALSRHGYAVIGWDCRKFADSRTYNHTDLVDAFNAAVEAVQTMTGKSDIPIWYGGWSTGAEQSVAAAATPDRPEKLVGLLLAAPGTRGRFGIQTSDLLGVTPTGPNSFALKDMAAQLKDIRVAQFAAGLDPLDDVDWLKSLNVPHRLFDLPGLLHDMGGAGPVFQAKLLEAIAWTLE